MSDDSLPRPIAPGPWSQDKLVFVRDANGEMVAHVSGFRFNDAAAIAALPDLWDAHREQARRMDAVRALCEASESPHAVGGHNTAWDLARDIIDILDRGGEAS